MIAVVGAAGQLGSALVEELGEAAVALTRTELDLEALDTIEPTLEGLAVDAVVNCAAYTAVDRAEADEPRALRVNGLAVGELARACRVQGKRFVTVSTDYVFDGSKKGAYLESDPTGPLGAYGRTKLEGERLALGNHPDALVVRSSWILSSTHRNFASTILDLVEAGPASVVSDQIGNPTIASDLAPCLAAALEREATGIVHLAGAGVATWYELAVECATLAGLDAGRVAPCTTDDLNLPAPRPRNSVLGSERREGLGIPAVAHHAASLGRVVSQLVAAR